MAQEVIYTKTKSHYDKEADWNPAKSATGTDVHTFTVPADKKYARYSIDVEIASLASGYSVENAPQAGVTGEQEVRIRWWYNSFGKLRYILSVYAGEPETVTVWHGENNWTAKAIHAVQQEQDLILKGRGKICKKLFSRMQRMSPGATCFHFKSPKGTHAVAVTERSALHLIATIKYAVVGGLFLQAFSKGYTVWADFDAHGMFPFDDELNIHFKRQA